MAVLARKRHCSPGRLDSHRGLKAPFQTVRGGPRGSRIPQYWVLWNQTQEQSPRNPFRWLWPLKAGKQTPHSSKRAAPPSQSPFAPRPPPKAQKGQGLVQAACQESSLSSRAQYRLAPASAPRNISVGKVGWRRGLGSSHQCLWRCCVGGWTPVLTCTGITWEGCGVEGTSQYDGKGCAEGVLRLKSCL